MEFTFSYEEEQDCPLAISVAAFLDTEHYPFLHGNALSLDFLEVNKEDRWVRYTVRWKWLGISWGQEIKLQWIPPGRMRTTDIKPHPRWVPSIHHIITVECETDYKKHPDRDTTIMTFSANIDIPFWCWPLRHLLKKQLIKLHKVKDLEDLVAIKRRERIFGDKSLDAYLVDHQLMFHKDDFIRYFGKETPKTSQPNRTPQRPVQDQA